MIFRRLGKAFMNPVHTVSRVHVGVLALFTVFCAGAGNSHAGGPSAFNIDGGWSLTGGTIGVAGNGVPIGFEVTLVDVDEGIWHGFILDYRYTFGEGDTPHGFALGYEFGLELVGADLSVVSLQGDGTRQWGSRARGCGVFLLVSVCGGVTVTDERSIWGIDVAGKLPVRHR